MTGVARQELVTSIIACLIKRYQACYGVMVMAISLFQIIVIFQNSKHQVVRYFSGSVLGCAHRPITAPVNGSLLEDGLIVI